MAKDIKISDVSVADGKAVVTGTVGEQSFQAAQLQWGSKVLMHVTGGDFDRGTRVSIGHAAKKAVRAQGIDLTPAPLKRPRKAKTEVTEATTDAKVEEASAEQISNEESCEQIASSGAEQMMAKLDLIMADDGFYSLEAAS